MSYFPAPYILARVANVDLKATGNTAIFTVPTGRSAVITEVVLTCTAATAISVAASASVGQNAATYDDIMSNRVLSGLTASALQYTFVCEGTTPHVSTGVSIFLKINGAATGTSQVVTCELIGYLR